MKNFKYLNSFLEELEKTDSTVNTPDTNDKKEIQQINQINNTLSIKNDANKKYTITNIVYVLSCLAYYNSAKLAHSAAMKLDPSIFNISKMNDSEISSPTENELSRESLMAAGQEELEQSNQLAKDMLLWSDELKDEESGLSEE